MGREIVCPGCRSILHNPRQAKPGLAATTCPLDDPEGYMPSS
ncbi:MAG: hypothetical protein GC164_09950 [Phycisphaera sp.]|nr:hypothetical protein [Phycisphaera sp.]